MSCDNTIGYGATLAVNDGSGGAGSAFGVVVGIVSLGVPDVDVLVIESKRLDLDGRVICKLAGLKDGGEFTVQYEFAKGRKDRLDALVGSDREFKITLPVVGVESAYTKTFPGFIRSNRVDPVVSDGIVTCTMIVVVTGPAV